MRAQSILLGVMLCGRVLIGDIIECDNGDRYNGKVLSMDEKKVTLKNDIAGILTVPRHRIVSISFREGQPVARSLPPKPTNSVNVLHGAGRLQVDPASVERVQNELLSTATPEANQMYNEMVRGLMSGQLSAAEIRGQAQATLQELRQLQTELGDDETAGLLNSYGAILENFLKQAPANTNVVRPGTARPASPRGLED